MTKKSESKAPEAVQASKGDVTITYVKNRRGKSVKQVTHDVSYGGKTEQCHKDRVSIGNIMSRYEKLGVVDHVVNREPQYLDCTSVADYQSSMNVVLSAQEAFASLDAKVRARFMNDPVQFLKFMSNPENEQEMRDLGLLKEAPQAPQEGPQEPPKEAAQSSDLEQS